MGIETSCLDRKVTIGERVFTLSVPTVGQSVEILHVLEHLEDEEDTELLFELVGNLNWTPPTDIRIHLRNLISLVPRSFIRLVQKVILQGYTSEKIQDSTGANEVDYTYLIARYCRAFPGTSPYEVWETVPFPFFCSLLPNIKKELAQQKIDHAHATGAGFSGKIPSSWKMEAGYSDEEEELTKPIDEEEIQNNRQSFKESLI